MNENNLDALEGIQMLGKNEGVNFQDPIFRLALYEEMKQMNERAKLGNEMAHGFAEELTLYLSKEGRQG